MKIVILFFLLLIAIMVYGSGRPEKQVTQQHNIIILLIDDVGYGDLSSYGHPIINTPNMDKLANEGIRFTFCVTASGCVPSRT